MHACVPTRAQISKSVSDCAVYEVSSDYGLSIQYRVGKIICRRSCLQPCLNTLKPSHTTIGHMLALCNGRDFKMDSHGIVCVCGGGGGGGEGLH